MIQQNNFHVVSMLIVIINLFFCYLQLNYILRPMQYVYTPLSNAKFYSYVISDEKSTI